MIIDPATPADLAALHVLIESAYRGDSARAGWSHEADLLGGQRTDFAALAVMLADPAQAVLVARDGDGGLVGCVAIADRGDGISFIGLVTVDPARQAAGLGRQLLAEAERCANIQFAANRSEMTVISLRTELISWYERRGYARTGETRPFPGADPRFGLPRRNDLIFVVLEKPLTSSRSACP